MYDGTPNLDKHNLIERIKSVKTSEASEQGATAPVESPSTGSADYHGLVRRFIYVRDMCEETCAKQNDEIKGEDIDRIEYKGNLRHPTMISIYLKDGKMIQMTPQLDQSAFGIRPIVKVKEGTWGRLDS